MIRARMSGTLIAILLVGGCGPQDNDGVLSQTAQKLSLRGGIFNQPGDFAPPEPTQTVLDIVEHHSPIFYQPTSWSSATGYAHKYTAKINFDYNYDSADNKSSISDINANYPLTPYVYYSYSSTLTHHFIGYYLFHPYHSEMNGVVMAVVKNGYSHGKGLCTSPEGCLVAMITRQGSAEHERSFRQHYDAQFGLLLENGSESLNSAIPVFTYPSGQPGYNGNGVVGRHSRLYVSSASPTSIATCYKDVCDNVTSGIVYYRRADGMTTTPASLTGGSGNYTQAYGYGLISMDSVRGDLGPWSLRYHRNDNYSKPCSASETCFFKRWGRINNTLTYSTLSMPWAWDDNDDGPSYVGDWLCDPVKLFDVQFDGPPFEDGRLSHQYTYHPYWTHRVKLNRIRATFQSKPYYVNLRVESSNNPDGSDVVFDKRSWRGWTTDNMDNTPSYGGGDPYKYDYLTYGDTSREHHFCRPGRQDGADTAVRIRGYASDSVVWYFGAWMGYPNQEHVKTAFPYCSQVGCAEVDFEISTNSKNEHELN